MVLNLCHLKEPQHLWEGTNGTKWTPSRSPRAVRVHLVPFVPSQSPRHLKVHLEASSRDPEGPWTTLWQPLVENIAPYGCVFTHIHNNSGNIRSTSSPGVEHWSIWHRVCLKTLKTNWVLWACISAIFKWPNHQIRHNWLINNCSFN